MMNERTTYEELLKDFGCTLKDASYDESNDEPMTESPKRVVNFDAFCAGISKQHQLSQSPKSCDVLYRNDAGMWFLIEFKNGSIEFENKKNPHEGFRPKSNVFHAIIRKLFESLLLLTNRLGQTVAFTREKFIFILVYNDEKNDNLGKEDFKILSKDYIQLKESLAKRGHRTDLLRMCNLSEILPELFCTEHLDKLYVKRAYICSKNQFENEFVKKFAKTP